MPSEVTEKLSQNEESRMTHLQTKRQLNCFDCDLKREMKHDISLEKVWEIMKF